MEIEYQFFSNEGYLCVKAEALQTPLLLAPGKRHPKLLLSQVMAAIAALAQEIYEGDARNQEKIIIRSEKHGPFYHVFSVGHGISQRKAIVLAVTELGKKVLRRDIQNMSFLYEKFGPFFPTSYLIREINIPGSDETAVVAVLEWLEDYLEIHACIEKKELKFEAWAPGKFVRLGDEETLTFFRESGRIISSCYDPTFNRRISGWSHITGDFVYNRNAPSDRRVRLTTVRYYSEFKNKPRDNQLRDIYSLILLFLEICILNRIDRERGIGDLIFLPEFIVKPTIDGILFGLRSRPELSLNIMKIISQMDPNDLFLLYENLLDELTGDCMMLEFIQNHLKIHVNQLYKTIKSYQ